MCDSFNEGIRPVVREREPVCKRPTQRNGRHPQILAQPQPHAGHVERAGQVQLVGASG